MARYPKLSKPVAQVLIKRLHYAKDYDDAGV